MDFDRALLLLQVIQASIGINEANLVRSAAVSELIDLGTKEVKADVAAQVEQLGLDLSGKPVDDMDHRTGRRV